MSVPTQPPSSSGGDEPAGGSPRPSRKDLRAAEPRPVTGAQLAIGATLGRTRPRGRVAWVLAVVVLVAVMLIPLGVFALHGRPEPAAQASVAEALPADVALDDALEVTGRLGAVPVVTLRGTLTPPQEPVTDCVITGTGRQVDAGDGVLLSVSSFSGQDGTNTTGGRGRRTYRGRLEADELGEQLAAAVRGRHEGSRLVLRSGVAAERGGSATAEVTVIDVMPTLADAFPDSVPAQPVADDLPRLTMEPDGAVSVDLSGLEAPARGSATLLVQGAGEQVHDADTLVARYQVVSWATGQVRTTSYGWQVPPALIHLGDTFAGLAQRLVDVHVGSRVLVTLPADEARGEEALAVVVDVLAIAEDSSEAAASATPTEVVRVTPSAGATAASEPAGS